MAPSVLTSRNDTQRLQKNTLEVTPKKVLHDLCGRQFVGKIAQKRFGQICGNSGKNLRTPKNLPAPTPMMKMHLRLHYPLLKGHRGKCSCHASILRRPCAYYSTISLLVVVGYNVSLK